MYFQADRRSPYQPTYGSIYAVVTLGQVLQKLILSEALLGLAWLLLHKLYNCGAGGSAWVGPSTLGEIRGLQHIGVIITFDEGYITLRLGYHPVKKSQIARITVSKPSSIVHPGLVLLHKTRR